MGAKGSAGDVAVGDAGGGDAVGWRRRRRDLTKDTTKTRQRQGKDKTKTGRRRGIKQNERFDRADAGIVNKLTVVGGRQGRDADGGSVQVNHGTAAKDWTTSQTGQTTMRYTGRDARGRQRRALQADSEQRKTQDRGCGWAGSPFLRLRGGRYTQRRR